MQELSKQFGKEIKQRRVELRLTQRELAFTAGVGERFIVDLEAGKPTCQIGKALNVAKAVGFNIFDKSLIQKNDSNGYDLPELCEE